MLNTLDRVTCEETIVEILLLVGGPRLVRAAPGYPLAFLCSLALICLERSSGRPVHT